MYPHYDSMLYEKVLFYMQCLSVHVPFCFSVWKRFFWISVAEFFLFWLFFFLFFFFFLMQLLAVARKGGVVSSWNHEVLTCILVFQFLDIYITCMYCRLRFLILSMGILVFQSPMLLMTALNLKMMILLGCICSKNKIWTYHQGSNCFCLFGHALCT